jgi:hypothetical protein
MRRHLAMQLLPAALCLSPTVKHSPSSVSARSKLPSLFSFPFRRSSSACLRVSLHVSERPVKREGVVLWQRRSRASRTWLAFEVSSKRRRSYPSEARVKRGDRVVHGSVELVEKLGRNDLCPCGSGRRFQALLPAKRSI